MPDIPHPVLVLYGDQGAGKTTTARILAGLIDPSSAPLVRARDEQEFAQALAHHYIAILDNLSFLPEWLSNLLSRAVTGEGFTKRRLYTDDEDVTYSFRRILILTGINLVVTKPDLLDRSLIISTERVPDDRRLEDRTLSTRFTAIQSELFGALLDLMVRAMAAFPSVTLKRSPRMADFARWGAAISRAQGRSLDQFDLDYDRNLEQQNEQAIAESLVGSTLLAFMEDRDEWDGTADRLLGCLQTDAGNMGISRRDFPSTPQVLGRRLREIRPNLAAIGLNITFSGHHHPRTIRIIWNRRRA
jgi:energy-coupling factor transporter ATP-binding protein EcfA2